MAPTASRHSGQGQLNASCGPTDIHLVMSSGLGVLRGNGKIFRAVSPPHRYQGDLRRLLLKIRVPQTSTGPPARSCPLDYKTLTRFCRACYGSYVPKPGQRPERGRKDEPMIGLFWARAASRS
ncbi:hypothetical protein BaRGS_00014284 [Batillaria attramentaria]|uniref:Uncharacterized protein n=1 Tax=Batillaria attramentaria TaxID=370345 RepID=A0ABD0L4Z0_9CAEN